jgi:HJR/Mrr/RecB family endonuclease
MNGREFEEFVARKLQSQGFDVDLTKRTNDKGIDVIAQKGRYTYAVQAKHYSEENKVGSVAVQKTSGLPARSDIDGAMIVISSSFTSEAEQVAANRGVKLVSVNLATPRKRSSEETVSTGRNEGRMYISDNDDYVDDPRIQWHQKKANIFSTEQI